MVFYFFIEFFSDAVAKQSTNGESLVIACCDGGGVTAARIVAIANLLKTTDFSTSVFTRLQTNFRQEYATIQVICIIDLYSIASFYFNILSVRIISDCFCCVIFLQKVVGT